MPWADVCSGNGNTDTNPVGDCTHSDAQQRSCRIIGGRWLISL